MTETQKETLWKINDFKSIMESRISEQKVNDIIQQLDLKFQKELKIFDDKL